MFPDLTDGHLVIFRKALICNENLAIVAKVTYMHRTYVQPQYM